MLDTQQAIALAAFRGEAMARAARGLECAMMAVLGLDRDKLQQACAQARELGVAEIANYNCPGQLVVGGEKAAVERACALAKELGAKRCLPLKVSGPFHTGLMKPAGDTLAAHFQTIPFHDMALPAGEADLLEVKVHGGGVENGPEGQAVLIKPTPHARGLGPLAGVEKGELH